MKIFISRDLKPSSPLRLALETEGYEVIGESLLEFDYVPFNYFPECEWIFFYSPRCVDYFFESADPRRYKHSRFAVLGPGTARAMIARDIVPDFIGNGRPPETAEAFGDEAFEQRVLFPQAKNSRKSVEKLLEGQIDIIDIVVYSNSPRQDVKLPACDILIFTSPLNAETYFNQHSLDTKQKVIAIGETTAASLRNLSIYQFKTAQSPTVAGILAAMKE